MPFLREYIGMTLQWKRPRWLSASYELRVGDVLLATVNRIGTFRQHVIAEAEEQQWTFQRERQGLLARKFVIYPGAFEKRVESGSLLALASLQPGRKGTGTLNFSDGRTYNWTRTGSWRLTWSWVGPDGQVLLTMRKGRLLEIAPAAASLPDLALLCLFGLYLILEKEADEAATTAAVSSSAATGA